MAVSVGDIITESDYNTLRSRINTIMGAPSGDTDSTAKGYGQTLSSSVVSAGNTVTEAQWDNLRTDISKAYAHQTGSNPTLTNVDTNTIIDADHFNNMETTLGTVETNLYDIASTQGSTEAGITSSRATDWNGTITHIFTVTFTNADHRKSFFNAGGKILFTASVAYTGSEAKTLDWQSMLTDMGQIGFNYLETYNVPGTGTDGSRGTGTATGNYDLGSTNTEIFTKGGTSVYSENRYKIFAKSSSTSQITFEIQFQDNDTGDQQPGFLPGPAVDEAVKGTTTSTVQMLRPTGSNVSVAAPSFANTSTL